MADEETLSDHFIDEDKVELKQKKNELSEIRAKLKDSYTVDYCACL